MAHSPANEKSMGVATLDPSCDSRHATNHRNPVRTPLQPGFAMNLRQISSSAIALLLTAVFILAVGTYTDNGGFQLAGALILVVGAILAFNQARGRSGTD